MGFRLFSCGTSKDGDSFLVEWNESEGALKRTYLGFRKKSKGVVQFDTTRNRFLAVGEDNQIKFWDMDNTNMLTTAEAEGGLPVMKILALAIFLVASCCLTLICNVPLLLSSESSTFEVQQGRKPSCG